MTDRIVDFWNKHKEKVIFVASGLAIYRAGFRAGYKSSMKAVNHYITEASKVLNLVHF